MTVIRPNSISGITSITGFGGDITIFRADGTAADVTVNNITSGIITATHYGSGANLTDLPAANLTGNLPAISAANLTSIPAENLTGTVADARISTLTASKLSGSLPAIDGSNLTGVGASFGNSSVNTSGIITATAFVPTSQTALTNRNRIINGAMQIWQRGTSFNSQGNGQNDYTADRWGIGHNNSHMAALTQQDGTGADDKFQYCARFQRDSGQSQTDQMRFHTALETKDVIPLRGSVLTLSYYARKGANFSSTGSQFSQLLIYTGTNTDGDPNAFSGGHWTNSTAVLDLYQSYGSPPHTPTLTTSWQRFSHTTSAVSNSANSMIIEFRTSPTGTAGANDWYEITGVQLEIGPVATPFEHRSYTDELQRCQRFYQKDLNRRAFWGSGNVSGRQFPVRFGVEMRNTPTISFYSTSLDGGSAAAYNKTRQGYNFAMTGSGRFYEWAHTADAEL